MKIVQYSTNNVIYQEGDQVENIYFIKDGEIELSRKKGAGPMAVAGASKDVKAFSVLRSPKTKQTDDKCEKYNLKLSRDISRETSQTMKIALLAKGQCFGDWDIKRDCPLRTEKAIVTLEGTEVYSLHKSLLLDMLHTHKISDNFMKQNEKNQEFHSMREHEIKSSSKQIQQSMEKLITQQIARAWKPQVKLPDLSELSQEELRLLFTQFPFMKGEMERVQRDKKKYCEHVSGSNFEETKFSLEKIQQDSIKAAARIDVPTYQEFTSKYLMKPVHLKLTKGIKEKILVQKLQSMQCGSQVLANTDKLNQSQLSACSRSPTKKNNNDTCDKEQFILEQQLSPIQKTQHSECSSLFLKSQKELSFSSIRNEPVVTQHHQGDPLKNKNLPYDKLINGIFKDEIKSNESSMGQFKPESIISDDIAKEQATSFKSIIDSVPCFSSQELLKKAYDTKCSIFSTPKGPRGISRKNSSMMIRQQTLLLDKDTSSRYPEKQGSSNLNGDDQLSTNNSLIKRIDSLNKLSVIVAVQTKNEPNMVKPKNLVRENPVQRKHEQVSSDILDRNSLIVADEKKVKRRTEMSSSPTYRQSSVVGENVKKEMESIESVRSERLNSISRVLSQYHFNGLSRVYSESSSVGTNRAPANQKVIQESFIQLLDTSSLLKSKKRQIFQYQKDAILESKHTSPTERQTRFPLILSRSASLNQSQMMSEINSPQHCIEEDQIKEDGDTNRQNCFDVGQKSIRRVCNQVNRDHSAQGGLNTSLPQLPKMVSQGNNAAQIRDQSNDNRVQKLLKKRNLIM